jgi:glycosyltransferase involved in cell wall biosynthesis
LTVSAADPIDVAFFISPGLGGIWSVYRQLRDGLAPHGINLRWVGVGASEKAIAADPVWAPELRHGECVEGLGPDDRARRDAAGVAAVRHLLAGRYKAVIVNVLMTAPEMNVVRYLPADFPRVMVVHNITPGTYRPAVALRDHVHATIGVAPRIRDDFVSRFGFPRERTLFVANAVNLAPYDRIVREPSPTVRLIFLGRVEEAAKGVLWLPEIVRELADVDCRLTVAGDGPAMEELKARSAPLGGRVVFAGRVAPADVAATFGRHDVFLMTSRFEGCPVALIEAMAAGCVPVASRIRGVTDCVVKDGESGLLFPMGDVKAGAARVRSLNADRELLQRMSRAAAAAVRSQYTLEGMADAYARLIRDLIAEPAAASVLAPLPLEQWDYPRGFGAGYRRFVPEWAKNLARRWRA